MCLFFCLYPFFVIKQFIFDFIFCLFIIKRFVLFLYRISFVYRLYRVDAISTKQQWTWCIWHYTLKFTVFNSELLEKKFFYWHRFQKAKIWSHWLSKKLQLKLMAFSFHLWIWKSHWILNEAKTIQLIFACVRLIFITFKCSICLNISPMHQQFCVFSFH